MPKLLLTLVSELLTIKHVKKLQSAFLGLLILAGSTLTAQVNTTSIVFDANQTVSFVDYDYENHKINSTKSSIDLQGFKYVPNSFYNDITNSRVMFMTSSSTVGGAQQLIMANPENGNILHQVGFNSSMLPVHIARGNKLGMISTVKKFNGYNNNDNDNSFAVFNLLTGKLLGEVDLNSISFSNVQAPFLGEVNSIDGFNEMVKVGIGSPEYIAELNEVAFCALDVTGTYRLYRIDVEAVRLKSSVALPYFVMDLKYDKGGKAFVGLYVDHSSSEFRTVKVGKFSGSGSLISSTELRALSPSEEIIDNGSLKIDKENGQVVAYYDNFVKTPHPNTPSNEAQVRYLLNLKSLEVIDEPKEFAKTDQKVDFNYPIDPDLIRIETLTTSVKMFPNPAISAVHVSSTENARVKSIQVFSMDYKLVKDIEISGTGLNQEFDISNLAPGLYSVEIHTAAATIKKKLVVQ